ncbi:MAG TPA: GGDEF domain-containing protein [Anaeromyxobacteraceae bacterium]|nr:GGDEF domain-containing protein [Anaeromyxobacteraceae bacterium]
MSGEPNEDHPLWVERMAAAWIRDRSRGSATFIAFLGVLLFGAADLAAARIAGYDFVATPFYVVPIAFAAWAAGPAAGVAVAVLAAAVETVATWLGADGMLPAWILAVTIALEMLVFLGAAFTFARLRFHLERHRRISRVDALTGIANLRAFQEAVEAEVARADRRPAPISLAYLDVDRFKELNDARGHAAGDALLRLVAVTFRDSVRSADVPARLGGDEFALLLPETGADACRTVVERLTSRLRQVASEAGFDVTFSMGAVTFEGPPSSAGLLIEAGDRAMYKVKHESRDGVRYEVVPAAPRSPVEARRTEA